MWGYPTKPKYFSSLAATNTAVFLGSVVRYTRPVEWSLTVIIQHCITPYMSFLRHGSHVNEIHLKLVAKLWGNDVLLCTFPWRHSWLLLHAHIAILAVNLAQLICGAIKRWLGAWLTQVFCQQPDGPVCNGPCVSHQKWQACGLQCLQCFCESESSWGIHPEICSPQWRSTSHSCTLAGAA